MATIGIFDSGLGGLSVLTAAARLLPQEKDSDLADSAFCPYGEKTPEFIRERCRSITRTLLEKGAEIIVVACNTATGAAISELRAEYYRVDDTVYRMVMVGGRPCLEVLGQMYGSLARQYSLY